MTRTMPGAALVMAALLLPYGSTGAAAAKIDARNAAIHPVSSGSAMAAWLARVPVTRVFPDDFAQTLGGHGPAFTIEMTTAAGCLPCGDLWAKLTALARRYGWQVRTLGDKEAAVMAGRMGLPWTGHPVAWVRPRADPDRTVPIAIGTDHSANLARNLYLAAKMQTGVRPAVAVRAMAKFTGIVGTSPGGRGPSQ